MGRVRERDLVVLACLRQNARESLTSMSRRTGIPVSTLFDRIREHEGGVIRKHTAILDFARLGFGTRASVILRVKREDRDGLRDFLVKNSLVNTAYRINNGYDFLVEVIGKDMAQVEGFLEGLGEKFGIRERIVHYVIEELKEEAFFSQPEAFRARVETG